MGLSHLTITGKGLVLQCFTNFFSPSIYFWVNTRHWTTRLNSWISDSYRSMQTSRCVSMSQHQMAPTLQYIFRTKSLDLSFLSVSWTGGFFRYCSTYRDVCYVLLDNFT